MTRKTTLERLAQMVQRGFAETASRKELQQFRDEVQERFKDVNQRFDSLAEILRLMQDDNKRFKEATQAEIFDLWEHIRRLERKVGLKGNKINPRGARVCSKKCGRAELTTPQPRVPFCKK